MASSNIALNCAPESLDFDLEIGRHNKVVDKDEDLKKPEQSQSFDELRIKFYSSHLPRNSKCLKIEIPVINFKEGLLHCHKFSLGLQCKGTKQGPNL